ncbi:bifunctional glycosyltransferase/CDP-glycerol:glycerophosphate glycerophosphotransferase [Nocardioides conyzicola]|uniref:Glycosyltransferase 2-like domain-containing protein n=1 Tax=Nocardioides conyzicola TaxID=1651781 RepID=A0ABP8X5S0_9ACTN
MRSRQRLERTLVRIGRAAPPAVRGPLGRTTRALRGRWQGPRVTIVVAVSDSETRRIVPCLKSIRGQSHRNLDVLVVPYGPAAGALAAAREQAAEDWRIRIESPAADLASAWNAGAARARDGYLVFARGGDDLAGHAIERLVLCLEDTGSAMAVGRIEPPLSLNASVESPFEAAHQTEIRGTTLAETPVAITDLGVGNRMLRRSFWQEAGLRFDPRDRLGTELALQSYVAAPSFDLLRDATYIPTGRREGVSVGAVRDVLSELGGWLDEHAATQRSVAALELPDVLDWWLWGTLDAAIQPFLGDVERATPEQWARLRDVVDELVASGGESAWASLRADSRVKLWLVREDRRQELEHYVEARLFERSHRPTEVRDGVVLARLPYFEDPAVGVPLDAFEMREAETPLWAALYRIQWVTPQRLELRGFARIEHVDLGPDTAVRAWLVEHGSGERLPVEVTRYADVRANLFEGSRYQDYAEGAVTLAVDTTVLAARAAERGRETSWRIELEVQARGLTRTGSIAEIDDRASAGMVETGHLGDRLVAGARVGVRGRHASRFKLVAAPASGPRLVEATVAGSTVHATVETEGERLTEVRAVDQVGTVARVRCADTVGPTTISLELPRQRPADPPRRLRLVAVTASGREVGIAWPADAPQWLGTGTGAVALSRSDSGDVDVVDVLGTLVVEDIDLGDGTIDVTARWLGTPPARYAVRLGRRRVTVDGQVSEADGGLRLRFPMRWDEWGLGETLLPIGGYRFSVEFGPQASPYAGRALVGEGLLDQLLDFTVTDQVRMRRSRSGREAGLVLMPPLSDADRGQLAQARLQAAYRACDLPLDDNAVYLQSYTGVTATDSQRAIHDELRRSRPDLTIYWGVVDGASVVPEGGTPLLMHSREWYRVIATARYLCLNIDPDRWFALRPGQQMLQTFHGYPAKSMGIRMWDGKGYTPRRIELELARTSRDWSMILTPAPEMDEHYRREYRYDGPIHHEGYPRDDVLLSPDAERIREETRARLGIAPGQRAILYAPTWRDDLATNWRRAEAVLHLDVEAASRKLGRDYVLLMRGHRFHGRTATPDGDAQLVDVTHYPEINDLILASDAAVLDYSSLRFDFALTGRPMVFLVPDLATYTGGVRGFLYPFEESAPGPLVDTPDQVIALLRDLDGVQRQYADAMKTFHDRYNYLQDGHSAQKVVKAFFG